VRALLLASLSWETAWIQLQEPDADHSTAVLTML
jgi:hypothetical protein